VSRPIGFAAEMSAFFLLSLQIGAESGKQLGSALYIFVPAAAYCSQNAGER
jgi:hypothetical protein